jgi:hypothetical protein
VANGRATGTLVASPGQVAFGNVSVGKTASAVILLFNGSSAPLQITQLALTGPSFSVAGQSSPSITVSAGATYRLNVQFAPVASGTAAGQLTITSNASTSSTAVISLSGTGVAPVADSGTLVVSPSQVTFGAVSIGQTASATVLLSNEGSAPLEITQLGLTGQTFSVAGQPSLPVKISAGATYGLNVQFNPVAAGAAAGQLTVTSNASTGNTAVISLSGTGVAPVADSGTLVVSPSQVTFGTVSIGQTASATVLLSNEGSAPLEVTQLGLTGQSFSIAGQPSLPITINAGATYGLKVQFAPVASGAAAGELTVTSNLPTGNTAVINLAGTGIVPPNLVNVSVGTTPGQIIPAGFIGLSHEWGVAQDLAGTASKGKNLQYRQLLQNLLQYTAPMVIRIGGNSTDTTVTLRASDLESLNDLSSDLDSRLEFTLGVNMGADNPTIATTEIKAISAAIPASSLLGLELGNEPDSYVAKGIRPAGYSFADYVTQLTVWNKLVTSASQLSPISPALASYPWIASYENILTSKVAAPELVTQHYYAGEYLASQPEPLDFLLADKNATSGPKRLAPYIDAAHSAGKKLRIGEMNSLANGGQPGVSDAFASALWGIDIMFEFASVGADGVNWHTGYGAAYDLFKFSMASDPATGLTDYSLIQVRPLFYGLQLFSQATTSGGSLLPVTLNTQANIKVWALKGEDGKVRIVILNKDEAVASTVEVTIPGYSRGTAVRLLAPSLNSLSGVTLGGQTYDGSSDGNMVGQASNEAITVTNGSFTLTMPTVSGALVTLSN